MPDINSTGWYSLVFNRLTQMLLIHHYRIVFNQLYEHFCIYNIFQLCLHMTMSCRNGCQPIPIDFMSFVDNIESGDSRFGILFLKVNVIL